MYLNVRCITNTSSQEEKRWRSFSLPETINGFDEEEQALCERIQTVGGGVTLATHALPVSCGTTAT